MAARIFGGAVMFKDAVIFVAGDEFLEGVLLLVLVEFKLTELYFSFGFMSPVFGLLFSLEVVAESGVAFDTNNGAPNGGAVVVFALVNRSHGSNLVLCFGGWMACWLRVFFTAPPLHRRRTI